MAAIGLNVVAALGDGLLWVNIFALAVVLAIYAARRNALKFTVVETKLPRQELLSLIKELEEYYGWRPVVFNSDVVIMDDRMIIDRSFDPPLDIERLVGQRITIVFDYNKVYINSIINLYRSHRSRFGSRKDSAENVDIIREEILAKEQGGGIRAAGRV